jgi:hypothetical protein
MAETGKGHEVSHFDATSACRKYIVPTALACGAEVSVLVCDPSKLPPRFGSRVRGFVSSYFACEGTTPEAR